MSRVLDARGEPVLVLLDALGEREELLGVARRQRRDVAEAERARLRLRDGDVRRADRRGLRAHRRVRRRRTSRSARSRSRSRSRGETSPGDALPAAPRRARSTAPRAAPASTARRASSCAGPAPISVEHFRRAERREQRELEPLQADEGQRQRHRVGEDAPAFAPALGHRSRRHRGFRAIVARAAGSGSHGGRRAVVHLRERHADDDRRRRDRPLALSARGARRHAASPRRGVAAAAAARAGRAAARRGSRSTSALAWEARLRRRIFVATLAAVFVPSLLLALQYLAFSDLPLAPAHLFLSAAVTSCVARADLRAPDRDLAAARAPARRC